MVPWLLSAALVAGCLLPAVDLPAPAAATGLPPPAVPDPTFAGDGIADVLPRVGAVTSDAAAEIRLADGRLVVRTSTTVERRLASGGLDASFGNGGVVALPGAEPTAVAPAGSSLLVATKDSEVASSITKLGPDGAPDPAFGTAGAAAACRTTAAPVVQPSGRIVLLCRDPGISSSALLALTPAGARDVTFGDDGVVDLGVITSRGGPILDGSSIVVAVLVTGGSFEVRRFTPDGLPDDTFASDGTFTGPEAGAPLSLAKLAGGSYAMAVQSFDGQVDVVAVTPDGDLDPSFAAGGRLALDPSIHELGAIQPLTDGGLLLGGSIEPVGGGGDAVVLRVTDDGELVQGYGDGGVARLTSDHGEAVVSLLSDGTAAGAFASLRTSLGGRLAHLDAAGARIGGDALGGDLRRIGRPSSSAPEPHDAALDGSDRLVVVGSLGGSGVVVRFRRDGSLDPSFGSNGIVVPRATALHEELWAHLRIDSSGAIVVAGSARAGGQSVPILGRIHPDGSLDPALGPQGAIELSSLDGDDLIHEDGQVAGLGLLPDGRVLLAGTRGGDDVAESWVARLDHDGAPDPSFGEDGVATFESPRSVEAKALLARAGGFVFVADTADGSDHRITFAALASDGSPGPLVAPDDANEEVLAAVSSPGGKVLVLARQWTGSGGQVVRRYLSSLGRDVSFVEGGSPNARGAAHRLLGLGDGGALVTPNLTRFSSDGRVDPVWMAGDVPAVPVGVTSAATATAAGAPIVVVSHLQGSTIVLRAIRYRLTVDAQDVTSRFVPLAPARLLDTRRGVGRPGTTRPAPGEVVNLTVRGRGGVPSSGVSAVVLTVTGTDARAPGYVTVWPAGDVRPPTSNLNLDATGDTVANQVIVPVRSSGSISLYTQSGAHLVADVYGYFTPATSASSGRYTSFGGGSQRVLDTRADHGARPSAGSTVRVHIPYQEADAVVLNVTATDTAGPGYVTVWPAGSPRPTTSALNIDHAGETIAAQVTVKVGAGRDVAIYTSTSSHLVVDLAHGYTGSSSPAGQDGLYIAASPRRVLDTRRGTRPPPGSSPSFSLDPLTRYGRAAVLNVTIVDATGPGYVTAYRDSGPPGTSNLNADHKGQTIANLVTLPLSWSDAHRLYTSGGGHLLVDLQGAFT